MQPQENARSRTPSYKFPRLSHDEELTLRVVTVILSVGTAILAACGLCELIQGAYTEKPATIGFGVLNLGLSLYPWWFLLRWAYTRFTEED